MAGKFGPKKVMAKIGGSLPEANSPPTCRRLGCRWYRADRRGAIARRGSISGASLLARQWASRISSVGGDDTGFQLVALSTNQSGRRDTMVSKVRGPWPAPRSPRVLCLSSLIALLPPADAGAVYRHAGSSNNAEMPPRWSPPTLYHPPTLLPRALGALSSRASFLLDGREKLVVRGLRLLTPNLLFFYILTHSLNRLGLISRLSCWIRGGSGSWRSGAIGPPTSCSMAPLLPSGAGPLGAPARHGLRMPASEAGPAGHRAVHPAASHSPYPEQLRGSSPGTCRRRGIPTNACS